MEQLEMNVPLVMFMMHQFANIQNNWEEEVVRGNKHRSASNMHYRPKTQQVARTRNFLCLTFVTSV